MEIKQVSISEVSPWKDNPRNIRTEDFERLKNQIRELGVYKPMLAFRENGGYTVLGGNMRLRALRELKFKEVEISIVDPKTEAMKIKYALSDNDRAGQYIEQDLAELVYPHMEDINLDDFSLDIGEPMSLRGLIEDFAPSFTPGALEEQGKLDEHVAILCPKCGHEFVPNFQDKPPKKS